MLVREAMTRDPRLAAIILSRRWTARLKAGMGWLRDRLALILAHSGLHRLCPHTGV
jgi:hypothetical protein